MRPIVAALVSLFMVACDLTGDAPDNTRREDSGGDTAPTPDSTVGAPATEGCGKDYPAGTQTLSLLSGDLPRRYVLHVPLNYDSARRHALLLNFHGAGGSGQGQTDYSQMARVADFGSFVGVAPEANPLLRTWEREPGGGDDAIFVRDVVTELASLLCLDPNRVFAMGFSDGASFLNRLACSGFRFAGIGLVATGSGDAPCPEGVPMAVIGFHGTADPILAYDLIGPDAWAAGWARRNGCEDVPVTEGPGREITITRYLGCDETPVRFYRINEGGHTWPGGDVISDDIGPTTYAIDATRLIARFFGLTP